MPEKQDRCWPGYEPVKGKRQHEQGSCRPKAKSKLTPPESKFRDARRKQLDKWEAKHPKTRKAASQRLHVPAAKPKGAKAKPAAKKRAVKRASAKKSASRKH